MVGVVVVAAPPSTAVGSCKTFCADLVICKVGAADSGEKTSHWCGSSASRDKSVAAARGIVRFILVMVVAVVARSLGAVARSPVGVIGVTD